MEFMSVFDGSVVFSESSEPAGALEPVIGTTDMLARILTIQDNYKWETKAFVGFVRGGGYSSPLPAIEPYLTWLRDEKAAAPKTVNKHILSIKSRMRYLFAHSPERLDVLAEARLEKLLGSLKLMRVNARVSDDKWLTADEIRKVLAEGRDRTAVLFVKFLACTGCRIAEATSVRIKDCRRGKSGKYVVRVVGKGSKEREVKIPRLLYSEIREHYGKRRCEFLFQGPHGTYETTGLTNRIKKMTLGVLGRAYSAHCLRHAFATRNIERWGISKTSKYLGHSSVSITSAIYDHNTVDDGDLEADFAELGVGA